MALRVNYRNRYGFYTQTFKTAEGEKSYKVWFCRANCTCAMIHFYKREDENGKMATYVDLGGFFADLKHAGRCVADGFFNNCSGFTFKAQEIADSPEMWKLIKMLTKHGIKVTIK